MPYRKGLTLSIIILFITLSFSPMVFGLNIKTECKLPESSIPKQNYVLDKQDNNISIFIQGGLGISFEICNYGNTTLYLVNWSITIDGPLVLFGWSSSGSISEIPPGECVTINTIFILGLGPMNITVQIDDIIESANGYLIGPFVFLK